MTQSKLLAVWNRMLVLHARSLTAVSSKIDATDENILAKSTNLP